MRNAIRDALYAKLAGASALTALLAAPAPGRSKAIYHQEAPKDSNPPYVIFFRSSGMPDNWTMKHKPDQNEIWVVKAVSLNQADAAGNICDEIFNALYDAPLAPSGLRTLWCRPETDVDYADVHEGDRWIHLGYNWRLVEERTS